MVHLFHKKSYLIVFVFDAYLSRDLFNNHRYLYILILCCPLEIDLTSENKGIADMQEKLEFFFLYN